MDGSRRWPWLLASITFCGCTISSTTFVPLPPREARALERRAPGESAVVAEFRSDGRTVSGHVEGARSCRLLAYREDRYERVRTEKPHRGAGTLAAIGAGSTGIAGVVLLSQVNTFSARTRCDVDGCRSSQGDATLGALVLLGTSIVLSATAVSTFRTRETRVREEVIVAPRVTRTLASSVPCGSGPVFGLGLSVWRFDERLAATTTDRQGDAVLVVPPVVGGALRVVADSVPPDHPLVMPGETLGWVHVEPELP
jgi:hypothetical protein